MCILLCVATAVLVAGVYLNIREHREKERTLDDAKLQVFNTARSVIQTEDTRNKPKVGFHEVQPHKLEYTMFVNTFPPTVPHTVPVPKIHSSTIVNTTNTNKTRANAPDDESYVIQYV